MLVSGFALADEDDKDVTEFVEFQGGKLVKERLEVEIYDYHTGTYYTVDVYREPDGNKTTAPDISHPRTGPNSQRR